MLLQHRNDQHMVLTLRKPRYGDRPYTTCAFKKDRKPSSVRCEIAQFGTRLCLKRGLVALVR